MTIICPDCGRRLAEVRTEVQAPNGYYLTLVRRLPDAAPLSIDCPEHGSAKR